MEVGLENQRRNEPFLDSLCLLQDKTIGKGYQWVPKEASQSERDHVAARHRLDCYGKWASDLYESQIAARTAAIPPSEDDAEAVDEGGLAMRDHLVRERDPGLRKRKIASVRRAGNEIKCEVCRFDFGDVYGDRGRDYCEVHHRTPLGESGPTKTRLEDLAILCANCHRMIHRTPRLSVADLADLVARS